MQKRDPKELENLISKAKNLFKSVADYLEDTRNASKLQQRIKSEIQFLERLSRNEDVEFNIKTSNITYLSDLFELMQIEHTVEVFKPFTFINDNTTGNPNSYKPSNKVAVDLVCDDGLRWLKLRTCHNFENQFEDFDSDSSSSDTDEQSHLIIKQALGLVKAANMNLVHFQVPRIEYKFLNMQVDDFPTDILKELSNHVKVTFGKSLKPDLPKYHYLTKTLNLDVTTLIAVVSDLTHRYHDIPQEAFDSIALKLQRDMQQKQPILPTFNDVFKGKKLVCCQSAFDKFKSIIEPIGGPFEKARSMMLFPSLKFETSAIVNDFNWTVQVIDNEPGPKFQNLQISKIISTLSIDVCGTGYLKKFSTITSNQNLQRSLMNMGFSDYILVHEPRGLIEQKWLACSK